MYRQVIGQHVLIASNLRPRLAFFSPSLHVNAASFWRSVTERKTDEEEKASTVTQESTVAGQWRNKITSEKLSDLFTCKDFCATVPLTQVDVGHPCNASLSFVQ